MIAVESAGKELGPCLRAGRRLWSDPPRFLDTLADGCATQQSGQLTFPIMCRLVERDVITITDEQISGATRLFWERAKVRAAARGRQGGETAAGGTSRYGVQCQIIDVCVIVVCLLGLRGAPTSKVILRSWCLCQLNNKMLVSVIVPLFSISKIMIMCDMTLAVA